MDFHDIVFRYGLKVCLSSVGVLFFPLKDPQSLDGVLIGGVPDPQGLEDPLVEEPDPQGLEDPLVEELELHSLEDKGELLNRVCISSLGRVGCSDVLLVYPEFTSVLRAYPELSILQ